MRLCTSVGYPGGEARGGHSKGEHTCVVGGRWGGRERSSRARDSLEILSSGGLEAEIEAEAEAESPERSLVDWEIP